ncbi:hypothetical protein [Pseudaquabacterium rugosum]|uniref:Uncharacterized protein n=1 Tax=Pseudaquabacterium rugosum TaxID=2984194 RepID=A0ABU9BHL9_9BURK
MTSAVLNSDDIAAVLADNRPALERFAVQLPCPDQGRLPAFHSGARQRLGAVGESVLAGTLEGGR